jgi:HAMP domain-containing protein
MTTNYEWSDLIPIGPLPDIINPKDRLMGLVECLTGHHDEIMAHYKDLEEVLKGPHEEIDAFMELVSMQEEERQDTCEQIFLLLAEFRQTARPSTLEEIQAVEESVAEFREQLQRQDKRLKEQFAQMRQT